MCPKCGGGMPEFTITMIDARGACNACKVGGVVQETCDASEVSGCYCRSYLTINGVSAC